LGTSPAQLYRLLDQTNYAKSIDQLLALLSILDCEVELVVKTETGPRELASGSGLPPPRTRSIQLG
jgi:hypothetical protein